MTRYWDLAERTIWTAIQGGLAVWIATDVDLFSADALKVAGVAAVIAAAKCLLAFQVGSSNTAATLPVGPDTEMSMDDRGDIPILEALVVVLLIVVILVVAGVV